MHAADRLEERIAAVLPALAQGFLGATSAPTEADVAGAQALLYRPLFLLCAEARDLRPPREAAGLKRLKKAAVRAGRSGGGETVLHDLPVPHFAPSGPPLAGGFRAALDEQDWPRAFAAVEPLLRIPPFPPAVMSCLADLVARITPIEASRGDIARSERSTLAPAAQPYQDLLDRILYRLAGLTDDEAAGLEERLARML